MRKLSKVLSVLLAMVLLFSTASIGVEAAYNAYKDGAITKYDSIDEPVLTPDQYASMAMDEIDRMLAEENIKVEYDLAGLITIKADFSSIDKSLDSIADVYKSIKSLLPTIGGDVEQLDFSALVNGNGTLACPKRGTSGATDGDIFLHVLQFLADNADIIKKVPYGAKENGGLDLGIIGNFVNLGDKLNIPKMAKEALAKLVWPDTPKSELNTNLTVDQYVQTFIDLVASGNYSKTKSGTITRISQIIQRYVPGINEKIDLLNDSVYTIIDKGLKIALNDLGVPFANPRLKAALRRLCGYSYKKTKDSDGDTIWVPDPSEPDELNGLEEIVNVDFHLDTFPIDSWGDDLLIKHTNDILGQIVRAALNPSITYTWKTANGNDELLGNIITVAKKILEKTGDEFFASYVEVLSPEEVESLTDDQFVAYILRSILNGSIDDVFIPSSCDSTMEVLVELVKSLAATVVPSQDYANLPNDLDSLIRMGLDMAAVGLRGITNMEDLVPGLDSDEFADICMDWVVEKYGGLVSEVDGNDGWEKLSNVLFQIIPANWLPQKSDGSDRDNIYDIVFTDIVENILNFDLAAVLDLIDVNPDGELNGTIIEVLLARITNIINFVIPGVFPDQEYSTLESLLDADLLSAIIENLLTGLYDRAQNGLMDSLIPMLCGFLGLSSAEEFGYPYISLSDQQNATTATLSSFYMYNGSSGINTNATDKYGNKTQDKLYTYYIRSVETNNDAITVSPAGGIYINGGTSQTFNFQGDMSAAEDSVLKVTITYDVYGEKGTSNPITPQPLTATSYTYIYDASKITDDSEKVKADANPKGNPHLIYYKPTTYLSAGSTLGDLADYEMDLQRNAVQDSSTHTLDATFKVDNVVMDPGLTEAGVSANVPFSITTNRRGGSEEYTPYKVSDATATLPEGNYSNNFWFTASKTESAAETISFTHNVFVYDDFGLKSLLNSAVRADRQEANYTKGDYEAEYPAFGATAEEGEEIEMTSESVNGADAWDRYVAAVEAAAAIVYCPKQVGTMQGFVDNGEFESAAYELYEATQQLEAGSVSGGTAAIKAALDSIVAPDVEYIDENGDEVRYEYDDARHTYFAREDYISYTYSNFKSERRTAQNVLNSEKEAAENGEEFQIEPIRAAYIAHRVSLYGERLVRVKAYKTHLNRAIQTYKPLYDAGQGTYSNDSWNAFTRAYAFATSVNAEPVGSTIGGGENLANDNSLRQSKVNEARSQLIAAAKRLVEATPTVDYTQLQAAIDAAKATFEAGSANYTELSWNTFEAAYNAAVKLVADQLEATDANQNKVNNAATALTNAFNALEENTEEGTWYFDDATYLTAITTEDSEMDYIVGLDLFDAQVTDYLYTEGGYDFYVEANALGTESTGAVVTIMDANGGTVAMFDVVLFCDVTGDANIDASDASETLNGALQAGLTEWEDILFTDENAYAMAADADHNGFLDASDVSVILDIATGVEEYNQAWAQQGDPLYL